MDRSLERSLNGSSSRIKLFDFPFKFPVLFNNLPGRILILVLIWIATVKASGWMSRPG